MNRTKWIPFGVIFNVLLAQPAIAADPANPDELTPNQELALTQISRSADQASAGLFMKIEGKVDFELSQPGRSKTPDSNIESLSTLRIKKVPSKLQLIQTTAPSGKPVTFVRCPGALYAVEKEVITRTVANDLSRSTTRSDTCYVQSSSGQIYFTEAELLAKGIELNRRIKTAKGRLLPQGFYIFSDTESQAVAKLNTLVDVMDPQFGAFKRGPNGNFLLTDSPTIDEIQKQIQTTFSTPVSDTDLAKAETITTSDKVKEVLVEQMIEELFKNFESPPEPKNQKNSNPSDMISDGVYRAL